MPKATSSASRSTQVPAVGYTRRSTDKQEASIPDQTKAIQQYAADKGYKIVRWYTDDAISGDDTVNRHGFHQMLADAQQRRDFQGILCWDRARFGRFDSIEAGYYIHPLRIAGVHLATVVDGPIEWNDSQGRMLGGLLQEGKHQQLLDLSANVTRGQREAAKNASWLGAPPYGYRIEGEKKSKRLVIDDIGKVKVVRRIFREFVEEGRSMSDIAKRLHAEGYAPPGSRERPWRFDAVRVILENPAYVGDYASGRYSHGKYNTIHGKATGGHASRKKSVKNPQSQWLVRRDTHEAVIDRDTFERAQAILAKGKTGRSTKYTHEDNPFMLTGLLRCGKCGSPMWGDRNGQTLTYECGNWQYHGKGVCEGSKVREETILDGVADHLENWLGFEATGELNLDMAAAHGTLRASDLPGAFERVKKLVLPPTLPKQDGRRLKKRAEQLRADLAKARANLVLLDPDNIPAAQDRIRELDAELEAVEEGLKLNTPVAEKDVNATVLEVLQNLYSLAYCCRMLAGSAEKAGPRRKEWEKTAPQAVRRFLSHASHIVVHTTKTGTGKGTRHTFEYGEIVFGGVGVTTGVVNLRFLVVIQAS